MRGLLSFLLVMLLAESLLVMYSLYSEQSRSNDAILEQTLHMQDFYFEKIKVKREIQNLLAEPGTGPDPYARIEEKARRLAEYELMAELSQDYGIDVWCGYLTPASLELMSGSLQSNFSVKPLGIFEPSQKIIVPTQAGPKELHACSAVLVYDYSSEKISIGRGHIPDDLNSTEPLLPVIGVSISDPVHDIYDVDYVGVV